MDFDMVAIGTSLGGLHALSVLLAALPKDFPVPLAVIQHRDAQDDDTLRMLLQKRTALVVIEVEDKQAIRPGYIYLAPPNYHLLAEPGNFALSTEAPVMYARPSIDVFFESVADTYAGRAIGVILTGASRDGAQGRAAITRCGGLTIVQDPATAESPMMPEAAIAAGADLIMPLEEIGPYLNHACRAR